MSDIKNSSEMLTTDEAVKYLTHILELEDVAGLLDNENKHVVIDTIMESYREKEPFQNIELLSVDLCNRHRPSWSEIKEAMFLKKGGICYSHHVFLFELLKALGYNVSIGLASVGPSGNLNHIVLFIRNLHAEGDLYILETAIGLPSFHLISLEFEKESKIYTDSFLEYKYIKHGNKIMRMHRKGDPRNAGMLTGELIVDGWIRFYDFVMLEKYDARAFDKEFDAIYTDPFLEHFHTNFHFIVFKNRKTFVIHNTTFLSEKEDGVLEKKILKSEEDAVKTIQDLSPSFKKEDIIRALRNYKLTYSPNTTEQ